jgi:hypothetical protein
LAVVRVKNLLSRDFNDQGHWPAANGTTPIAFGKPTGEQD